MRPPSSCLVAICYADSSELAGGPGPTPSFNPRHLEGNGPPLMVSSHIHTNRSNRAGDVFAVEDAADIRPDGCHHGGVSVEPYIDVAKGGRRDVPVLFVAGVRHDFALGSQPTE